MSVTKLGHIYTKAVHIFSCIQRVSEISTLILTSDRSRQKEQNCYVPFFRNSYNFYFSII
jgi:hypothetical protein